MASVGNHALGAAAAASFLRGLEDQAHRAGKIARACQLPRCTQQYRGVSVVAAGVHDTGVLALVRQVSVFMYG